MAFTDNQTAALSAKLDKANVKRNPKGHDYIEGWHAIAEANRIFGFDGWDRELTSLVQVAEPYEVDGKKRVAYRATVRITVHAEGRTIVREGTGYGSGIVKDLNDAHESAVKEAETDAMKRALMTFGNPFGLALYDKAQENVEVKPDPALREAAEKFVTMFKGWVESSKDTDAAEQTWKANGDKLKKLRAEFPDLFEGLHAWCKQVGEARKDAA